MIIKEVLEHRIKQNKRVTVYNLDNIPLVLCKEYHIVRTDPTPKLEFEMDCKDLSHFCAMTGLTVNPTNHN